MSFLALTLNRPEMKLGEVLIPWIVIVGLFGFLAAWLLVAIMERTGLSRYVWHLPLFFIALVVLLRSVIGMFFQQLRLGCLITCLLSLSSRWRSGPAFRSNIARYRILLPVM